MTRIPSYINQFSHNLVFGIELKKIVRIYEIQHYFIWLVIRLCIQCVSPAIKMQVASIQPAQHFIQNAAE